MDGREEQKHIRSRCFHPHGGFREFAREEVDQSIPDRFAEQTRRYPNNIAVRSGDSVLTYSDLDEAANKLANAVLYHAGHQFKPVAILFHQGLSSVKAILGILKSGFSFVPMDPTLPLLANRSILKDSKAHLILADSENLAFAEEIADESVAVLNVEKLDVACSSQDPRISIDPDSPAYIFYTSGTTGSPKGVVDSHRNVLHNVLRYTNSLHISHCDRLSLLHACSSSATVSSLFSALLNGAAVSPLRLTSTALARLGNWVADEDITILHATPAIFRRAVSGTTEFPSLRIVRLEGDRMASRDLELYRKHCPPDSILVNGLGATECGLVRQYFIDKTSTLVGGIVPVGYPVTDMELSLISEDGNEVPCGESGEIAFRSKYIALGYWMNPEMTADRFLSEPDEPDWKLYRTGDVGRVDSTGCLVHLGRTDSVVKIRGQSVSISDVEATLMDLDTVDDAAVVVQKTRAGDAQLVAYIAANLKTPAGVNRWRALLGESLPVYMVPTRFVTVDVLPTTATGKIDREYLQQQPAGRPNLAAQFARPRTPLEETLAEIWADVLELDQIGIHDDFVELGGDSLNAATILALVDDRAAGNLVLGDLIHASTVAKMAELLENVDLSLRQSCLVPIQTEGNKEPFFCVHGSGGHVLGFAALARRLGSDRPFYGLEAPGRDGEQAPLDSVEALARRYIAEILALKPIGPYLLGGLSMGGDVAYEMAQQLRALGHQVEALILIDTTFPTNPGLMNRSARRLIRLAYRFRRAVHHFRRVITLERGSRSAYIRARARSARSIIIPDSPVRKINENAAIRYRPLPYEGKIHYLWSGDNPLEPRDERYGWTQLPTEGARVHRVTGDHLTMMREPHLSVLAERLKACLDTGD